MAPTLVVATSAVTSYPGGVKAVRAEDFMGPARGTLSSEVDAQAVSGTAVRDTQTTATSIWSSGLAAYQGAADTLVIPFSSLGLETDPTDGMTYYLFASIKIEGDWDQSNNDTYRGSDQHQFLYACELAHHGDSSHPADTNYVTALYKPRKRPHYTIVQFGSAIGSVVGTETLRLRAYARAGTTIEFLIDQIYFVPYVFSGTKLGEWTPGDFSRTGMQHNTFGAIGFDPPTAGGFVDGADGGDINGKFTWMPRPTEQYTNLTGSDGGGDYQQKSTEASSEDAIRVVPEDFYYLANTAPSPDVEASAVAYSLAGPSFRPAETWVEDPFTREVNWPGPTAAGSGWGWTPEGYGWFVTTFETGTVFVAPTYGAVDGSKGIFHHGGAAPPPFRVPESSASVKASLGATGARAELSANDLIVSGKFLATSPDPWIGVDTTANVEIWIEHESPVSFVGEYWIHFDLIGEQWWLKTTFNTILIGPVDVSGWYAEDSYVGFKIEIKRYVIRAKVWDATGAEPGTWDYEDFRPLRNSSEFTYPYNDEVENAITAWGRYHVYIRSGHGNAEFQWETHWDDIKVEYDPYGDPGDGHASMEQPHGTDVGEIEIPYGAWQFIYWGSRDWTDLESGFPAYLDFSGKVWNDVGVAELQRCEAPFWYFRSSHLNLVVMNWRSADRQSSGERVLSG